MRTLYLVATPIGNLEDITARALRVLRQAGLIAVEDTRRAHKLLDHYGIRTPIVSYHEHNKLTRVGEIIAALENKDVALISDAGTPALNDPGFELVKAAVEAGARIVPIPGPSAPIVALVASGLPTDAFLYLGYLPRRNNQRRRLLSEVSSLPYTLVFLEAPHRLMDSLQDMLAILGDRQIAIGRELTKLHEEILRFSLTQALDHFSSHPPRGEFTLVVAGQISPSEQWTALQLREALEKAIQHGKPPTKIAAELANQSGWPRRKIYQLLKEIQPQKDRMPQGGSNESG